MEGSDPPSKSLSPVASPPPDSVGQKVAQLESELKTNVKPAAGATSAEERCPICLEDFEDKAFIDACFHTFCFVCIVRWSETTLTSCPMCKTSFSKIIHNVRANDDYDVFRVTPKPRHPSASEEVFDLEAALRSFRGYRTTRFPRQPSQSQPSTGGGLASSNASRSHQSASRHGNRVSRGRRRDSRKPAAIERRRAVYSTGLRARPIAGDRVGLKPLRIRDVSAAFFSANPASTHRLYPWLSRELTVLVGEEHVQFIIQIILSLLDKVDMKSAEFASHLEPYLYEKTSHFMHEFISFATSPYDMIAYDKKVSYDWPSEPSAPTHIVQIEDTDSTAAQGPSAAMQERLFEELTSTGWEDSPPIVETLSPSYLDHSSDSEGLRDEDLEDSQYQSLEADEQITITRDQFVTTDQRHNTESVNEPQQDEGVNPGMSFSIPITDDNMGVNANIVDLSNDNSEPSVSETVRLRGQSSEMSEVGSSRSLTASADTTQGQSSITTEHNHGSHVEVIDSQGKMKSVNEDSTDYEIHVYVETEEDPSNQRTDELLTCHGDVEDMAVEKIMKKEEETVSRPKCDKETSGNSLSVESMKQISDHLSVQNSSKPTKQRSHSKEHSYKDTHDTSKRRSRKSVISESDKSRPSCQDVHRDKHRYQEDGIKQRARGHKRKRYQEETVLSDSASSYSSDDSQHRKPRHDISRERRWRDRPHLSERRRRSRSNYERGRPFNLKSSRAEQSPPSRRRSKLQSSSHNRRDKAPYQHNERSRHCSHRLPYNQGEEDQCHYISPYYQREKGHRSKLYSDDYPAIEEPQSQRSESAGINTRSTKCKEQHRKSIDDMASSCKGPSILAQDCLESSPDKSQRELAMELSGLEEDIKDSKRDLLKCMLRRERIELLQKNLHGLGADASDRNSKQNHESHLDPVRVGRKASTSDMQKELMYLEQAIVDEKKQLLQVMLKMEEDQVEQDTDDELI